MMPRASSFHNYQSTISCEPGHKVDGTGLFYYICSVSYFMEDKENKKPENKVVESGAEDTTPKTSSSDVSGDTKNKPDKTEKLQRERDEYLDGWKRAKADLINYKKDESERLEQVVKFANEDMVRELIVVLDSFDLALISMEDSNPAKKGTYLIKSKFDDILKGRGLEKIEVKKGDIFDPTFHEAIDVIEDESMKQDTIAEELEMGYTLYGKVIRATRVRVYK